MARLFDDAQNEHLSYNGVVFELLPLAVACWFQTDSASLYQTLFSVSDASSNRYHALMAAGGATGDPIWARTYSGSGTNAATSIGYSTNTWHHACGIWVAAADRRAFIDGGSKGTNATSKSPSNLDKTSLGHLYYNGGELWYLSGQLAEAAIWDLSGYPGATDSDKADYWEERVLLGLAAGWSPRKFPLGLVAHHPIGGLDTEETDGGTARDIWGGYDMTAYSDATGPGVADHAGGLIYPSGPLVFPAAAAAGHAGPLVNAYPLKSKLKGLAA